MISITTPNLSEVERALAILTPLINDAARFGTDVIADAVANQAAKNANTGHHKKGEPHIPGTGPGPNTVSTNLRTSIDVFPRQGFGTYELLVGSTVKYARAVELGNPRWKSGVKYPYLEPAGEQVSRRAYGLFRNAFASKLRG